MKPTFLAYLLGVFGLSCQAQESISMEVAPQYSHMVSIFSIISRPDELDKFENESIRVSGFLTKHFGSYLFASSDFAEVGDVASGVPVWLNDDDSLLRSQCLDEFVTVTGILVRDKEGVWGITDLKQVLLPTESWAPKECWPLN